MSQVNVKMFDSFPEVPPSVNGEHQKFPGGYDFQNTFAEFPGEKFLPAAGPDGTPGRHVKLHAAYGERTLSWIAVRFGEMPILPDPTPTDPNERLKYKEISPTKPGIMPDGVTHYFMVSGVYVYTQTVPTKIESGIILGHGPEDGAVDRFVLKKPNFRDYFK